MPTEGNAPNHREVRPGRTKDFLLYTAIAILILVAASTFGFHQGKTGGSAELPLKWMGFAGMTAIVFGYGLRACRREWRVAKFWLFFGLFFVLHALLGTIVLLRVTLIPLVTFGALTGIEYVILAKYLEYFMHRSKKGTA
jgi:hypothetical protein